MALTSMSNLRAQNNNVLVHIVQAKETVYSLAKRYSLEVGDIYTLNPSSVEGIQEGQTLLIPKRKIEVPNSKQKGGKHTIQAKETLYSTSRLYGLSEEELIRANPGIDSSNFPIGYTLTIPQPGNNNKASKKNIANYSNGPISRVAILLPLTGTGSSRYIEFYQGFLMGVLKMKKQGNSINLQVHNIDNTSDIDKLIRSGELGTNQLLIGGINDEQIKSLARYASKNKMQYVIPFYSHKSNALYDYTGFQINPPKEALFPFVAEAFVRMYKGQRILMLSGNDAEDGMTRYLREFLREKGIAFEQYSAYNEQSKIVSAMRSNTNLIIVPSNGKQNLLNRILSLANTNGSTNRITLFGHPEWQSFSASTLNKLRSYNSTFYTTFYFDEEQKESSNFLRDYFGWYNQKVTGAYPKYSILGYDIANYFISALAQFGNDFTNNLPQLASDGMQSDFHFRNVNSNSPGMVNCNIFFVTLQSNGKTLRTPIVN